MSPSPDPGALAGAPAEMLDAVIRLDEVADPGEALRAAYAANASISLATSGTTGLVRRIVRTAASWVDSFGPVAHLTGLSAGSGAWVPGPARASMNLFALTLADHVGAAVVPTAEAATHAFVTPARLSALLATGPGRGRRVVVAGDRLSAVAAERARTAGWRVSHYYGAAQLSFVAWGRDASRLRPFPEVEVAERHGVLWVRSPWVCSAELTAPGQAPALRRSGDWATVGDRGRLAADGRVLVGGRDEILLCGGQTVYPADVEAVLRASADGDVWVVPLPHDVLGAVPAAVCTDADDLDRLREVARLALTGAERPRRWFFRAEVPLTTAGKVDRAALATWAADRRGSPA